MAILARIARLRFADGLGNFREWVATADVKDVAAGGSVAITITSTSGGSAPPGVEQTRELSIRIGDAATEVRLFALTAGAASETVTLHLTSDGTATGAARSGTLRLRLRAARTMVGAYDATSDGTTGGPAGFTVTSDQGYVRGTTTAVVKATRTALADPAFTGTYAYRDAIFVRATLAARSYDLTRTLTLGVGTVLTASPDDANGDALYDATFTSVVDNRFAAALTTHAATITAIGASALATGEPWTALTTITAQPLTVDPRITFTHLLQIDNATWATPPTSNAAIDANGQRLATTLGFVAARATNARGEGINGLAWTAKLWDAAGLVGSDTVPRHSRGTTATDRGGEAGWSDAFLTWDATLPGGSWTAKHEITTVAAVGLEANGTRALSLVAPDPRIAILGGGGPYTSARPALKGGHYTPGLALQIGVAAMRVDLGTLLAVDAAAVAIVRLQDTGANAGYGEYLMSDGVTWDRVVPEVPVFFHTLTESAAGTRVYIKLFPGAATATWGTYDLFLIAKATIGGVNYGRTSQMEVVGPYAQHHGHA